MSKASGALALDLEPSRVGFWIHVTPRARANRVGSLHGDALRVRVKAPPVDGKANAACVAALAEALGVARRAVEIDPGARHRRKRVRITGEQAELAARLQLLASAD